MMLRLPVTLQALSLIACVASNTRFHALNHVERMTSGIEGRSRVWLQSMLGNYGDHVVIVLF
jgi:hypothetical protein